MAASRTTSGSAVSSSLLDAIVRDGARQMLAAALAAEVAAYIEAHSGEFDLIGHRLAVRNGLLTGDHREERHLHTVNQAGAHQRARFNDRLPCERNGTSDSSFSRATTSTASPLTTVAFGQSRGPSSVVDTTVAGRLR